MASSSAIRLLCLLMVVLCFSCGTATRPPVDDAMMFGKPQRQLLYWYYRFACAVEEPVDENSASVEVSASGTTSTSSMAMASFGDGTSVLAMAECLPQKSVIQTCHASREVRKGIAKRFRGCGATEASVVEALLDADVPFKLKPDGIYFEQVPDGVKVRPLPPGASLDDYRMQHQSPDAQTSVQVETAGDGVITGQVTAIASIDTSDDEATAPASSQTSFGK